MGRRAKMAGRIRAAAGLGKKGSVERRGGAQCGLFRARYT